MSSQTTPPHVPVVVVHDKKPSSKDDPLVAKGKMLLMRVQNPGKKEHSEETSMVLVPAESEDTKTSSLSEYVAKETDNLRLQQALSEVTLRQIEADNERAVRAILSPGREVQSRVPSLRERLSKLFELLGIRGRERR